MELIPRYRINRKPHVSEGPDGLEFGPGFDLTIHDFPETHPTYTSYFIDEVVRDIKESSLRISDTIINENTPTITYEMPDGSELELGNERFRIPELLINNTAPLENGVIGY
jgi:hypothetical protein